MSILFNYTFRKIFFGTSLLTSILVLAIWLTQSLRSLDLIVNRNVSVQGYFYLVGFLIPDLLVLLLPIGLLISVIFFYNKFQSDHELAVWRSIGLSDWQIAKPALLLTLIVVSLTFAINVYILPSSFKHFKETEHSLRQQFSGAMLQEGRFNTFNTMTAYVKQRYRSGRMEGIFIHHKTNAPYTVFADEGRIVTQDNKIFLSLKKGYRQEFDPKTKKLQTLKFDTLHYDLSALIKNNNVRTERPYEKSLNELFHPEKTTDAGTKIKYRVAAHQRILTPLYGIMYVLIALNCLLKVPFTRRGRYMPTIITVSLCFFSNLIISGLINMNRDGSTLLVTAYLLFTGIIAIAFLQLFNYRLSLKNVRFLPARLRKGGTK